MVEVGLYSGTVGDSLAWHNNMAFRTTDKDNDLSSNCAVKYTGAWCYRSCHHSNLKGKYLGNTLGNYKGIVWYRFKSGLLLKFTVMKLRP